MTQILPKENRNRVITQTLPKENRNSQSLLRFYQRRTETDEVITQILPKENRNSHARTHSQDKPIPHG